MEKTEIFNQIQELFNTVNNGINLTPKEKREMTGMGPSREAFVKEIMQLLNDDDSFLPKNYDSSNILNAYKSFTDYANILKRIEELRNLIHGHFVEYGTLSFKEALKIKRLLDNNPDPKFDEARKRIGTYFKNKNANNKNR